MDVLDFINRNGQRTVPNPNYNPKSKKNTEPPTIIVPDAQPIPDDVIEMAKRDALNQFSIASETTDKYREFGLNYNPKENLDKQLADAQSNWSKAINALGQTLVSEIAIGTVKGVSDLIDFVGQKVGLSDHNYSNPVSQYLEEKQKEFEEWAPVYVDPDNNTLASQFNGGFNLGYWFSNIPSIASSLTLLIPSTGITKALSWAGKARNISKYTNRAARAIVNPVAHAFGRSGFTSAEMGVAFENGINAALSRTMENYQEARQTYNDSYIDMSNTLNKMSDEEYNKFLQRNAQYLKDNNVDTKDRDSVAKQLARSAADRTFQIDFANVIFDAYQIYGLRNILTHAPRFNQSAATRAAQRNAMRTAGMTEEQAAAELAKDSKLTKIGYWVNDNLFGFGRQIKSELSEGVEEAVNYIAQQEGTHLGKYLLTGENGDPRDLNLISSIGPMTSRILNDYYNDTGLWDSAFWGVVGGVVFQAGGSKLNRISQTIKNRQEEKKSANKDNAETQEAKVTPHWWALDQSAETERMLTEINGRNYKLNTLRTQMQKINSGKNPYIVNENKTNPDISSPVEERMLREKAYTEYLDEIIITARNNGTLNMLEAYLEDSNVQDAIVAAYQSGDNSNRVSKEEAQQAAAKASERVKKIDRMYQDEIIHASNIADKVGDKEGTSLPAEYIQMIASSNVRHRLNLERYDEVAAMYNEDTERIKSVLGDRFDSTIDYKGLVSLRATIQELSSLIAQKKELEDKQKEKPTLTTQFDIEEIDNQINLIKRKALQTSKDAQLARTLYALQVANSAVREYAPDGKSFKINASDADLIANLDNFLMNDLSYIFDEVGQEKRDNISNDAVLGELRKVMNDMRYILPVDTNGKRQEADAYLENLDPKLPENYDILARIELEKIKENARLAETEQEIRHYISAINNMENVARKRVIEDAFNTLSDIQKNHTDLDIIEIANGIYDENNADWLIETNNLTDEERTNLRESLKVLNLADVKNRTLFDTLAETLIYTRATQTQVDANNKQNTEPAQVSITQPGTSTAGTQTQNSSTSQNPISEQSIGQPINQSQQGSNAATGQGNGQIEQTNGQTTSTQITLSYNGTTINYIVLPAGTANTVSDIAVKPLGNDNFELDFVAKGSDVRPEDISNTRLFDVQQQPMDGAVVKRNPIVRFGNNNEIQVISQGIVENPAVSSTGEQNGSTSNAQSYIDRIESANTKDEVDAIYNEAINNGIQETELGSTYSRKQKEIADTKKIVEPEAPVRGADPAIYVPQIAGAARAAAMKLKNGETIIYEEYLGGLSDVKAAINDDVTFLRLAKNSWQTAMQRLAKRYPETVDSIINSLQSSTTEEIPESNLKHVFDKNFTSAVEKLVKAYLKDIGQKKVNGKYVISLENLLRYCNGEFQNNENAEILYNVLASYLKSDEASNLYDVIETKEEISAPDFLDNVKTPLEERIDKAIRQENHRINTIGIKNKEVFDELEEGQELTMTQNKDRIYFQFNGKEVGYIGKPKVVNGTYSSPYEYFLFRIRPNGKDTYYSKLADVFKAIVNAKNGELKEIYDAALSGSQHLKGNSTWNAIKSEYAINTIDKETGEEYDDVDARLLGVIKTMASFAIKYGSAAKAIDGWFNALAQEYISADYLAKNKDTKITIAAISDGFLIKATDKLTDDGRNIIQSEVNKLPLASQAIGRNNKGKVSIAVGSRRQAGAVECVVKKENDKVTIPATYSFPGVGYSNTFVAIPISKGRVLFAQAYPITARELTRGSEAAKIVSAFSNQFTKYLDSISRNPGNDQLFRELQDFLFEALNYKNSTTPLFHMDNCEKVNNGDDRGTHIGTNGKRGPRRDLRIFCNPGKTHIIEFEDSRIKDSNGRNIKHRINITQENIESIKKEVKNFLADTLQFNISEAYIASDNNTRNQVEGLATRDKDGKFVINIGDETWTFDSYNDFILDNDLVRVNTKSNEYGNNVTRTSNNPNIRYKIVTSSPVEKNVTGQSATVDVAKEANNIMSSSRTDKAAALARLVFDDDTVTTLSTYDLLPHNLVFDAAFNTGDGREKLNASFNKNTKVTTIGPRFLSMLSNTNYAYRKQAIRKLIHERLHDILHSNNNEHYINDIRNIYDAFVESLNNAEAAKPILEKYLKKNNLNISLDDYYENFKKYKYLSKQTEEERLEEFLVDTLTSVELANYLNNVTSLSKINMRERKRDTLLNKIMRLLAKIMGVNIKSDSLYAQEFEALRKAMDTTAEQTVQFEEETTENVQQPVETQQPKVEETPAVPENKNIFNIVNDETNDEEYSSTTEEYSQNDYTQEMNNIKERAIADGTFMKAPNGNPTNLTERQWMQVRTKKFKDWFGDWEIANKENPYNKDVSIGPPEADFSNVDDAGIGVLIPIFLDGEYIGETGLDNALYHKDKGISIKGEYMEMPSVGGSNITIEEEYRGKGYGKAAYFELAKFAANNGKILRSAPDKARTPASTRVWESLVRDGYAKKVNNRYEIINSTLNNASKVIDENGEPLVVYHGTTTPNITIFDLAKTQSGRAFWFANMEAQKGVFYSDQNDENLIMMPLFVNMKTPLLNDADSMEPYATDETHDGGLILGKLGDFKGIMSEEEYQELLNKGLNDNSYLATGNVTNPNQLKSATDNIGAFSTKDDNIYNSDTTEEYESVASIGDYIWSYSPEDRAEIAREINNGNISIKCK